MPKPADERVGAAADRAGHMTRSPERRVEADECKRDDEDGHRDESKAPRRDREPAQTERQNPERRCEDEHTAAVRARLAPADRNERERREWDEPTESANRRG